MGVSEFIIKLKKCNLSKSQKRILKGQALAGDIAGAKKGLDKLTKRVVQNGI